MDEQQRRLMEDQVNKILRKDDPSSAELDFVRKYWNDKERWDNDPRAATRGYTPPAKALEPSWEGLTFDEVKVVSDRGNRLDTGTGSSRGRGRAGDSSDLDGQEDA